MELPKNITQIGESNPHCKIYVEDYVISYIKQLNQYACDKGMAVALYGVHREEEGITYLFLYGACKLVFLQKECRHLSQAVQQEVEKQRKRYFAEYAFLGYLLLDGEMVEGFHICEQNVCRYIEGYAQFYEKNDSMLAFMLAERKGETKPEEVNQEKYDMVKKRQEERRMQADGRDKYIIKYRPRPDHNRKGASDAANLKSMKMTAAAVFVLLGVTGLAAMGSGERMEDLRSAARQLVDNMTERQLPEAVEVSNGSATGVIVAEDKLTEAIRKENAAAAAKDPSQEGNQTDSEQNAQGQETGESAGQAQESVGPSSETAVTLTPEPSPEPTPAPTPEPTPVPTPEPAVAPATELVAYTVQRGDTLIGICLRKYGSDSRVAEICSLNNIANPDDIKEGEKIFLPQ